MNIYAYSLFAYAVTAAISLLVVVIIVAVSRLTGKSADGEKDKEDK